MEPGRASQTAVLVCMGRAAAHGTTPVARFADPTALALLPDDARARVERFRAGTAPKGVRARLEQAILGRRSKMMVVRTVAIDDAVRAAASPQLVILGAGLDGRAWRMPELRDVIVFEIDHPDSQRDKQARVAALAQAARDVRFVPVDFAGDALDDALTSAGHDPARPTTWVWEGVVMYLTPADVEATLAVIERRSAAGSRLIVAYHSPALMLRFVGLIVRRLGEPLRSAFTADALRALLAKHGFGVIQDEDLPTIAATLSADIAHATRVMKHLRIATADRLGPRERPNM
jgi:methyltransferase (TIGR00027 family)